jgi:hypothetical protein
MASHRSEQTLVGICCIIAAGDRSCVYCSREGIRLMSKNVMNHTLHSPPYFTFLTNAASTEAPALNNGLENNEDAATNDNAATTLEMLQGNHRRYLGTKLNRQPLLCHYSDFGRLLSIAGSPLFVSSLLDCVDSKRLGMLNHFELDSRLIAGSIPTEMCNCQPTLMFRLW